MPGDASEPPILEAIRLCRSVQNGRHQLLDHASLTLRRGERLAVVGPTGSGKTVLLRALALLDPLESGDIQWHQTPVASSQIPEYRSRVMYLPQRPALPDARVADILKSPYGLHSHRTARFDRDRIGQSLEVLGRDPSFLEKRQRELSGGEAQIVALLRSLQLNPEVLLLDEPTAALDSAATQAVETLVMNWFEECPDSRALIWVTHEERQVERVTTRVLQMLSGRLQDGE